MLLESLSVQLIALQCYLRPPSGEPAPAAALPQRAPLVMDWDQHDEQRCALFPDRQARGPVKVVA